MEKGTKHTKYQAFVGKEINPRKTYNLEAAEDATGIKKAALRRAVKNKELRGRKCGKCWKFTGKAILDYIEGKNVR
ncbi:helix-turn-helix domain-containing protein [Lentisphaerota bacterium WC36G]|nr:helix-turn-helix domain-containing protein [Lentisphaerae bacterium WC36]